MAKQRQIDVLNVLYRHLEKNSVEDSNTALVALLRAAGEIDTKFYTTYRSANPADDGALLGHLNQENSLLVCDDPEDPVISLLINSPFNRGVQKGESSIRQLIDFNDRKNDRSAKFDALIDELASMAIANGSKKSEIGRLAKAAKGGELYSSESADTPTSRRTAVQETIQRIAATPMNKWTARPTDNDCLGLP